MMSNNGYNPYQGSAMNYSNNQGGGFFQSESGAQGENDTIKQKARVASHRHCTVKQIKDLIIPDNKEDQLTLDGLEIGQAILIGVFSNVEKNASNTTFQLCDGTGSFDIKVWNTSNQGQDSPASSLLETYGENQYIQAVVSLKVFANTVQLVAIDLKPIRDHNKITEHFLIALHTHLSLTKGKREGSLLESIKAPRQSLEQSFKFHHQEKDETFYRRQILRIVYDLCNNTPDGAIQGAPLLAVKKKCLSEGISPQAFDDGLIWLNSEGHIFNGATDEYVMAASSTF